MTRLEYYRDRSKNHILYKRLAAKLNEQEQSECESFILAHDHLEHIEFERAANRFKLNQTPTKNHNIMVELLLVANCAKMRGRYEQKVC